MSLEFEIDLTGDDVEQLDRTGGVPPGWYRVVLEDVTVDAKVDGIWTFTFRVTVPHAYANYRIKDTLRHPDLASSPKAADACKKRLVLFAKRLNRISGNHSGQSGVKINWEECLGSEVVLDCEPNSYTDKDGVERHNTKIKFDGIYAINDDRIPEQVKKMLGIPTLQTTGGSPPAGAPASPSPTPPTKPTTGRKKINYGDL